MREKVKIKPEEIRDEYQAGTDFKASLGDKGLFEQTRRNERFYIGDQWHGAKTGNDRPLIRRNIIKRIGEYKMSTIAAAPVTVNYSADGIPNTVEIQEEAKDVFLPEMEAGVLPDGDAQAPEISAVMGALSDYFRVTAERLKFEKKKEQLLRNSFISGTGILFTYWDSDLETGLYADENRQTPIKGDIACEVLDVENVVFGDPNNDDVQSQPYIILSKRQHVEDVRREARRNHLPDEDIIPERDDGLLLNSGDRGTEPEDTRRVTVYTKLYKQWNDDDKTFHLYAIKTTDKAIVRKPWDLKIKRYPLAVFPWERRRSSIYGESEVTYLIPNQIAVNRALTAAVWGLLAHGMPSLIVNGDLVPNNITNDPGQIIRIYGSNEEIAGAAHYLNPPNAAPQFQSVVDDLCKNTLSDAGANDAALGNMRPDNASAIIQMREAAMAPLQIYMNRFYDFIEDVARSWADFWLNLYGDRQIRVENGAETKYLLFRAKRYQNLLITARVDVGASTLYSEAVIISSLDALRSAGVIDDLQYLERMPPNIIPNKQGLIEDIKNRMVAMEQMTGSELSDDEILQQFAQTQPELYEAFTQMSPEEQRQILEQIKVGMQPQNGNGVKEPQMPMGEGTPINAEGV